MRRHVVVQWYDDVDLAFRLPREQRRIIAVGEPDRRPVHSTAQVSPAAEGDPDATRGRLIGYVEPHINSWDCLAALAIIQAAGGTISDFPVFSRWRFPSANMSVNFFQAASPGC